MFRPIWQSSTAHFVNSNASFHWHCQQLFLCFNARPHSTKRQYAIYEIHEIIRFGDKISFAIDIDDRRDLPLSLTFTPIIPSAAIRPDFYRLC